MSGEKRRITIITIRLSTHISHHAHAIFNTARDSGVLLLFTKIQIIVFENDSKPIYRKTTVRFLFFSLTGHFLCSDTSLNSFLKLHVRIGATDCVVNVCTLDYGTVNSYDNYATLNSYDTRRYNTVSVEKKIFIKGTRRS